jgi:hypothetical protein
MDHSTQHSQRTLRFRPLTQIRTGRASSFGISRSYGRRFRIAFHVPGIHSLVEPRSSPQLNQAKMTLFKMAVFYHELVPVVVVELASAEQTFRIPGCVRMFRVRSCP